MKLRLLLPLIVLVTLGAGFINGTRDFAQVASCGTPSAGHLRLCALTDNSLQVVDPTGRASTLGGADRFRPCEVVIGGVGTGAAALANDNDSPEVCANLTGATLTILEVKCWASTSTGSPSVLPILTGGAADSILSAGITCGNGTFGPPGSLNGTPVQSAGATIDANIAVAGGSATRIVIRINRTL